MKVGQQYTVARVLVLCRLVHCQCHLSRTKTSLLVTPCAVTGNKTCSDHIHCSPALNAQQFTPAANRDFGDWLIIDILSLHSCPFTTKPVPEPALNCELKYLLWAGKTSRVTEARCGNTWFFESQTSCVRGWRLDYCDQQNLLKLCCLDENLCFNH